MNPKTKTVGLFIATFLLGVLLGAIALPDIGRMLDDRGGSRSGYREMFRKRLELTQEQSASVDSLLDRYRVSMDQHRIAIQSVRDSLRSEIRMLLTERQKERYEQYIEEMNKRENRHGPDSAKAR